MKTEIRIPHENMSTGPLQETITRNVPKIITYQNTRGTQIFQQYKGHLKIQDVKLVARNRLYTEDPEKLGATVKEIQWPGATRHPGFVHPCRRPSVAIVKQGLHWKPKGVHLHKFECISSQQLLVPKATYSSFRHDFKE